MAIALLQHTLPTQSAPMPPRKNNASKPPAIPRRRTKQAVLDPTQRTLNQYYSVRRSGRTPESAAKVNAFSGYVPRIATHGSENARRVTHQCDPLTRRDPSRGCAEFLMMAQHVLICQVYDAGHMGQGIRTRIAFEKGAFVCEYSGDLIPKLLAEEREARYAKTPDIGCYMYYFEHKGKHVWWVFNT